MGQEMEFALAMTLTAAFLHAGWNAMVKSTGERRIMLGLISLGHTVLGLVLISLYGHPVEASWPFIAASTLIHWLYYAFLLTSYRLGDLSQVYPVARGIAPVLVAIGGWIFAGEALNPGAWGGILFVSFGISLLAANAYRHRASPVAILAALATGTTIAAYSVVDGLGARLSENPLGYIGWLFLFEGLFAVYVFFIERTKIPALGVRVYWLGLFGGLASSAAYGMVIFAKTLAPLGAISAVRESSVIVAALIGVFLFGERPWELRLVSAMIVVAGILLLVWSS